MEAVKKYLLPWEYNFHHTLNGIYVGNELKKANNNILIFIVTSFAEYLDEAM